MFEKLKPFKNLLPGVIAVAMITGVTLGNEFILPDIPERLSEAAAVSKVEAKGSRNSAAEEDLGEAGVGSFTDGVYEGSAQGYGGPVQVRVTVQNGQIVSVEILNSAGETTSFFNKAIGVIDKVLHQQTWDVDTVSGATYSSRGILGAIQNAITGVTVVNEAPETQAAPVVEAVAFEAPADGYKDGTYTGTAQGFGGPITVSVTISGGQITSVNVVSAGGETAAYYNQATAVISRIISAQSPAVDTVSGATYSSRGIINAVKRALSQAASGNSSDLDVEEETESSEEETEAVEIPDADEITAKPEKELDDGVYTGTGEGFGGDVVVHVTVSEGLITNVEIVSAEDETAQYFNKAVGLIPDIIKNQSTDVDTVSGATYSSGGIIDAVKEAVSLAEKKEETPEDATVPDSSMEETEPSESEEAEEPEQPSADESETIPAETVSAETTPAETVPAEGLLDGVYQSTVWVSPDETEDFWDYQLLVNVTVSGGVISEIAIDPSNTYGEDAYTNQKRSDRALNGYKTYTGINAQLTGKSEINADEVDVVSTATCTSKALTTAASDAVSQAKKAYDDAYAAGLITLAETSAPETSVIETTGVNESETSAAGNITDPTAEAAADPENVSAEKTSGNTDSAAEKSAPVQESTPAEESAADKLKAALPEGALTGKNENSSENGQQ